MACSQISEIDYAPMCMDVWQTNRKKDSEMIVFGDGGGYVRLFEVRMNPTVRVCLSFVFLWSSMQSLVSKSLMSNG